MALAPGAKRDGSRVSMQNVAAYAGVSIATVSKVMQGVPSVLPENVTKVQNAIEALGYRINPLGAELRRGRRNLVGVIVPTLEHPGLARFLTALETRVEARNHALFVATSRNSAVREAEVVGRMTDWRVAGIVIVPVEGQSGPSSLLLDDAQVPAVFVERASGKLDFDSVVPDYAGLAREVERMVNGTDVLILHPRRLYFGEEALVDAMREVRGGEWNQLRVVCVDAPETDLADLEANGQIILLSAPQTLRGQALVGKLLLDHPAPQPILLIGCGELGLDMPAHVVRPISFERLATKALNALFERIADPSQKSRRVIEAIG